MTGDGFDGTLAYLIAESVGRLAPEDRQERIEHCQRTRATQRPYGLGGGRVRAFRLGWEGAPPRR
jgi:hypothetical protein